MFIADGEALRAYVAGGRGDEELLAWVEGLGVWGRVPLVIVAAAAARAVVGVFERDFPDSRAARECIELTERWLEVPGDSALARLAWGKAFSLGDPDDTRFTWVIVPGVGTAEHEAQHAYWAASYAAAATAIPSSIVAEQVGQGVECAVVACGDEASIVRTARSALEAWLDDDSSALGGWFDLPRRAPEPPKRVEASPRVEPPGEARPSATRVRRSYLGSGPEDFARWVSRLKTRYGEPKSEVPLHARWPAKPRDLHAKWVVDDVVIVISLREAREFGDLGDPVTLSIYPSELDDA